MSNTNKKNPSAIVQSVLDLDETFEEMKRMSKRIENLEIRGDSDFEQLRDFMARYAQSAESIGTHVATFSQALIEARTQAETSAAMVAARAEMLQSLHNERQKKMEAFHALNAKVTTLTLSLKDLNQNTSVNMTDSDRSEVTQRLVDLANQLGPLIEEAQNIRQQAQASKMTALEKEANSLRQSLVEVNNRLNLHH